MRQYLLLFALAFAPVALGADVENPYKSAKVGDVLKYKMTVKSTVANLEGSVVQTVTAVSEKEVAVKTVTTMMGKEQPAKETKIDLTKDDPAAALKNAGMAGKIEKLKDGKEEIEVGGKKYDCAWTSHKFEPGANAPKSMAGESEVKVWTCKTVPGMVKMTTTTKIMNQETSITMELVEFTQKK